ncbi:lipid A biosynthesis lauroyl acyltransferase [Prosthecomicrobium pneumaticum]|uniref:KDO2-lipid IV(A) lauroyltransferase n=1 Tax=Prosthecomicrobium pneumaticum TaxID=81895 RepID=A0A7W9FLY4_9HYPH|nr:lipid A biosynthesis lauroyl acyltransferase [Prosthecomicrobium pneumaticum]MBB5753102.1 KDO2-lipid IV(A) lauroyltransferase [Prosthecomicrobium pneumaticum]
MKVGKYFRKATRRLTRSRGVQFAVASGVRGAMGMVRSLGPDRAPDSLGRLASAIGRFLPEERVARKNIAAAFPEKSEAERERILRGAWASFGRLAAEYVHLESLVADIDPERPTGGRIEVAGVEHFLALRDDGRPGIIFSAHLGCWEMLPVVAARYGLPLLSLYRAPVNAVLAKDLARRREALMGRLVDSSRGATFEIGAALERGDHLGLLTDQFHHSGHVVTLFGRQTRANPLVGRLARQYECPVHGARSIRLPDGRYRLELTPAFDLPRDAEGRIDAEGTTALVMSVVEGWVREHPEQWLWQHDRWKRNGKPLPDALAARGPAVSTASEPCGSGTAPHDDDPETAQERR